MYVLPQLTNKHLLPSFPCFTFFHFGDKVKPKIGASTSVPFGGCVGFCLKNVFVVVLPSTPLIEEGWCFLTSLGLSGGAFPPKENPTKRLPPTCNSIQRPKLKKRNVFCTTPKDRKKATQPSGKRESTTTEKGERMAAISSGREAPPKKRTRENSTSKEEGREHHHSK